MARRSGVACYCYIVECVDGSFYTGWTTHPDQRIKAHNNGSGSRYTRAHRPVRLVLLEPQVDRPSAMRRERAIKMMTRASKMRLIDAANAGQATGARARRRSVSSGKGNLKRNLKK